MDQGADTVSGSHTCNALGTLTVSVTIDDDGGTGIDMLTVTVLLTPPSLVNKPPVGFDDAYSINIGGELNIGVSKGVLANDTPKPLAPVHQPFWNAL